ncbi:hypothetical protein [Deinococcus arenicola]|uniref:Uncharacterized protein n=1 Tax=Deinococcus arenicola TaxID=2994950 RepID=A0ABU4DUD9_9DEIO|nr:hypothetical protein [Deinococcus sp. ZS9-10]MDV6376031.1 hypothetical protein [Deinococcus sp. ZS9-10]
MTQHALYVGAVWKPITCGYTWAIPKVDRVGQTQHTPYGEPWDDGQAPGEAPNLRASPSSLILMVGGVNATAAAQGAEGWTQAVLGATRIRFEPTGRFMRLLLARAVGERDPVRGTFYKIEFQLEYKDPFWHDTEGDGSTRLSP